MIRKVFKEKYIFEVNFEKVAEFLESQGKEKKWKTPLCLVSAFGLAGFSFPSHPTQSVLFAKG